MSFFGNKDIKKLEQSGFTCTRTLFKAPALALLPALYVDEEHELFAVKLPGADPSIFSFNDLIDAQVVEAEPADLEDEADRANAILARPGLANQFNAAQKDVCLGLGVNCVFSSVKGQAQLTIPCLAEPSPRKSARFAQAQEMAYTLLKELSSLAKREFT